MPRQYHVLAVNGYLLAADGINVTGQEFVVALYGLHTVGPDGPYFHGLPTRAPDDYPPHFPC